MTIIPGQKRKELRGQFKSIHENKLSIALFIAEQMAELQYGQHDDFWKEMVEVSGGMAAETLRQWGRTVEGYDEKKLRFWLSQGLSWDHFETAKYLVNWCDTKGKTAESLLDDCLAYGSAEGDGHMSVQDMLDLYLHDGQKQAPQKIARRWLTRLFNFNLHEWTVDQKQKYADWKAYTEQTWSELL